MNAKVIIRLHSYSIINFSQALGDYQENPCLKTGWTCYLLSLIAPEDAELVDWSMDFGVTENSRHQDFKLINHAGKQITVRPPLRAPGFWDNTFQIRAHLEQYIVNQEVIVHVSLDEAFIDEFLKTMKAYYSFIFSHDGCEALRFILKQKIVLARAIEPILQENEAWKHQRTEFQTMYQNIATADHRRPTSGYHYTFHIFDDQHEFDFVLHGTHDRDWWASFPETKVQTPCEPRWV